MTDETKKKIMNCIAAMNAGLVLVCKHDSDKELLEYTDACSHFIHEAARKLDPLGTLKMTTKTIEFLHEMFGYDIAGLIGDDDEDADCN